MNPVSNQFDTFLVNKVGAKFGHASWPVFGHPIQKRALFWLAGSDDLAILDPKIALTGFGPEKVEFLRIVFSGNQYEWS